MSALVDVPPRSQWPFALPGAPELLELRWRARLRRAPLVPTEEHAARVGMGEIEEAVGCPLCGERTVQPLLRPGAAGHGPPGDWSYHVVRCPRCGMLFRDPGIRPERLGDLYAGDYSAFLTGAYARKRRRRYRLTMDAYGPLLARGRGRRLLDYGCGTGLFLREAHRRGFDPYGVDLSPDSIERAREHPSGRNAYLGAPLDVPEIAAGGFDVITLWSVLAHLPRPVEDLTMLRGLLDDDGVLLVLTVNANSLKLKADGDRWNGFTANHLVFFSPTTIADLFRRAGFGAVVLRPWYGDPVEAGTTTMSPRTQARLKRAIDDGNRGNMLRVVAFADPEGPGRRRRQVRRGAIQLV